jgi:uncharacterized protein (DUF433 family)
MSQASIEHITVDEKGVARLIGRRTKVMQIAVDRLAGMSPDEIKSAYPDLTLSEIYAALAYYYDHQQEIDDQISEYQKTAATLEHEIGDKEFFNRIRARSGRK